MLEDVQKQRMTGRDIAAMAFRHRRVMILGGVGILLGAVLGALMLPKYEAETKILVNKGRVDPVVAPMSEQNNPIANYSLTEEELNSEVELLNSHEMLRKVVIACDLEHPKTFLSKVMMWPYTEDERIDKATEKLDKGLDIEAVPKANVITITYDSLDAQMSARVLASLDKFYLDKHLAVNRPSGQFRFFEHETQVYKDQLQAAEDRLADFPFRYHAVIPDVDRDETLLKLNEFNASWQQTQAAEKEAEERIHKLEEQAATIPARHTTLLTTADNPQLMEQLKGNLLNLELKRIDLLANFQPDYRPVQDVQKQINDTLATINKELKAPLRDESTDVDPTYQWVVSELAKARTDLSGLQARSVALQRTVAVYQTRVRDLDRKGIVYNDLVRSAKAHEDNYLLYLRKQEESRITDALDEKRIINVAIVEDPLVPALPKHSALVYGLAGALLAVFLITGLIFSLEYLDRSFRTPREVEGILNIPVLAAIPYRNGYHSNGSGHGRKTDDIHSVFA